MNVLVLGGGGLAGSAIMGALQADGHTVSGTCRNPANSPALLQFDLDRPEAVLPLLERTDPEAVISCLRGDFALQLEAHRLAADWLGKNGGRMVYLSTANVFDALRDKPHYEGDQVGSDSTYGQFKIRCEGLLRERLGDNCAILRPPEIWGRDCPRLRTLVQKTREGAPVRTYENLSVNYATDVQIARWVSFILRHDLRGVFHVGTRDVSGYTAFLDRLAQRLGLPRTLYDVHPNGVPSYQAVLPGRTEIPNELQLSVDGVLDFLSEKV